MNKTDRFAKLEEKIQAAITDYVSEADDQDFSALISVSVKDGWTAISEIKSYSSSYIDDNDTGNAEDEDVD